MKRKTCLATIPFTSAPTCGRTRVVLPKSPFTRRRRGKRKTLRLFLPPRYRNSSSRYRIAMTNTGTPDASNRKPRLPAWKPNTRTTTRNRASRRLLLYIFYLPVFLSSYY